MIRAILAFLAILLAAAGAVYLADHPGRVTLVWQGWRIDTTMGGLVLAILILFAILYTGLRLALRLIRTPRDVRRRRRERRLIQGYRALTLGLVAIASGDGKAAERQRRRGERAFERGGLPAPPLSRLLAAQSALLRQDDATARSEFGAMLDDPDLAFLGLRGLIVQALKAGDNRTALDLTQRARRLEPGSTWVIQAELALEARGREWRRAAETLRTAVGRGVLSADTGRRHHTALLVARSRDAEADRRLRDALTYAAQAHALDEAFVPAAVRYAELLAANDRTPKGLRVLETAWVRNPHPEIAQAYDKLLASEAPVARFRRFDRLVELRPDDREAHLAAAAVALNAKLWGETRRHLDRAGAQGPGPWPARLCHLMAEVERRERQDAAAAEIWQDRSARAPAEPGWICRNCGAAAAAWDAVCPACQSFGTLDWRAPGATKPGADDSGRSGRLDGRASDGAGAAEIAPLVDPLGQGMTQAIEILSPEPRAPEPRTPEPHTPGG